MFCDMHSIGFVHGIEMFFKALTLQSFKSLFIFSLLPDLCDQLVILLAHDEEKNKIKIKKNLMFINAIGN